MPDEETPRPREHAARDDSPPGKAATPDPAGEDAADERSWASPAADVVPPLRDDTPRPPRIHDDTPGGGWFGRLRSLVRHGDPGDLPSAVAPPWRSPGASEEPLTLPAPTFEAPPRPALLEEPQVIDAPPLPSMTRVEPEASEPSDAQAGPDMPDVAASIAPTETEPSAATALPETPGMPRAPGAASRFGQFITVEPEPTAPPEAPVSEAPASAPEVMQPALFDAAMPPPAVELPAPEEPTVEAPAAFELPAAAEPTMPEAAVADAGVPDPGVPEAERELLESPRATAEAVEHAIEHAVHEATEVIEHPPAEAPEVGETPPVPPLTVIAEALPLPDPDAESPEEEAEEQREAALIAKGGPFSRFAWPSHPHYWNGFLAVITGLATLSFLVFVLVEPSPRWILLIAAAGVTAGMDGVLRATWRAAFARGEDTTSYLFLPALYVFAAPMLIEHNVTGHTVLAWALFAGVGFGAIAVAEVLSVRTGSRLYPYARMVTTGAAYFAAFSLFAMTYVLDLRLIPAFVATWLVGAMLAIEVVREGEVDPVETAVFAGLVGLLLAQVRWLLFYLPVDGYLAGLALVLVFYFVTGVLHSYVLRQLNAVTAAEYALVTTIGMVLLGAARVAGLA